MVQGNRQGEAEVGCSCVKLRLHPTQIVFSAPNFKLRGAIKQDKCV